MPYITKDRRIEIGHEESYPVKAGELNYAITKIVKDYVDTLGLSYQTINDIVGALEGAKMEFYRRIAVPYEETKIKENGDVY